MAHNSTRYGLEGSPERSGGNRAEGSLRSGSASAQGQEGVRWSQHYHDSHREASGSSGINTGNTITDTITSSMLAGGATFEQCRRYVAAVKGEAVGLQPKTIAEKQGMNGAQLFAEDLIDNALREVLQTHPYHPNSQYNTFRRLYDNQNDVYGSRTIGEIKHVATSKKNNLIRTLRANGILESFLRGEEVSSIDRNVLTEAMNIEKRQRILQEIAPPMASAPVNPTMQYVFSDWSKPRSSGNVELLDEFFSIGRPNPQSYEYSSELYTLMDDLKRRILE